MQCCWNKTQWSASLCHKNIYSSHFFSFFLYFFLWVFFFWIIWLVFFVKMSAFFVKSVTVVILWTRNYWYMVLPIYSFCSDEFYIYIFFFNLELFHLYSWKKFLFVKNIHRRLEIFFCDCSSNNKNENSYKNSECSVILIFIEWILYTYVQWALGMAKKCKHWQFSSTPQK